MDTRVSYYFGVVSLLWAAVVFFPLFLNNTSYHVPLSSALVAIVSSLVVGAVSGAAVSLKQLRVLAAKGETRISLVTWRFIIGVLPIIFSFLFFLVAGEQFETLLIISNFVSPMVPAVLAAKTLLFARWEQKHKRVILFASIVSSKLYVFPKIDSSAV